MPDLSHAFATDLAISPNGDLATIQGPALGQQRVLRRLLTNPGDYIWNLTYGAGLASFIGQPTDIPRIRALIRSQIFKESAVARTPEPLIDVAPGPNGTVSVHIRYADTDTGQTQILSFTTEPT